MRQGGKDLSAPWANFQRVHSMKNQHIEEWSGLQWLQGLNQSTCCEKESCTIQLKCTNKKIIRKKNVNSLTQDVNFHNYV